jgi:hypothetical protein
MVFYIFFGSITSYVIYLCISVCSYVGLVPLFLVCYLYLLVALQTRIQIKINLTKCKPLNTV